MEFTPLPGATTAASDAKLDTVDERAAARDTYISASGPGIKTLGPYVWSITDGDQIQLKGGATGASFFGFLFWSKLNVLVPITNPMLANAIFRDHAGDNAKVAKSFVRMDIAGKDTFAAAQTNFNDKVKELEKTADLIAETDVITLKPGETFTVINRENLFAKNFFTERPGFIQWSVGFEVRETQFNEAFDGNDEFGQEIEDRTKVKGLATQLFKFLKPTTPPPEDFEIAPEEEGGTVITTGDPLVDQLRGLGAGLAGLVAPLITILLMLAAMFLLFMFRSPIAAVGKATGNLVQEALTR